MATPNKILMQHARESLHGKWRVVVGGYAIFLFASAIAGSIRIHKLSFIALIIGGPFAFGLAKFSLALSRNQDVRVMQIFSGFHINLFLRQFKAYLFRILFIFLWTLLFIVPGIIAALSYSQMFYILAEDPTISASDAMKKSKKMMYGNKWKYFCLDMRFVGWILVCILTLGIGFLWVFPYLQVSSAKFYEDISKEGEVQPEIITII